MHSGKKRCRVCVDKIMDKLTKSVVTEDKHIHILLDNKPGDIIDISEDNEEVDDVIKECSFKYGSQLKCNNV